MSADAIKVLEAGAKANSARQNQRAQARQAQRQEDEVAKQQQTEDRALAESTDEVARRRELIRRRGQGRGSLISTSLQGVQELGGATNA